MKVNSQSLTLPRREFMRVGNVGGVVAEFVAIDPTVPTGDYSTVNYYHYNHRGDVIAVTRNSQVIFEADYDAYGTMIWSSGDFKPRYTFSTKRSFEDFGAYYYGYRWYLPELGRWMQKDLSEINSDGLNAYAFCRNRPTGAVDGFGLVSDDELINNFGESYKERVIHTGVSPLTLLNPTKAVESFMNMDSAYNQPANQEKAYRYDVAVEVSAQFLGASLNYAGIELSVEFSGSQVNYGAFGAGLSEALGPLPDSVKRPAAACAVVGYNLWTAVTRKDKNYALDIPKKLYWTFWGMSHHRDIRDNARRRSGENSKCQ